MEGALPIWILLATMLGTTGLNFLLIRLCAVFFALSMWFYWRKESAESARNAKGNAVFHDGLLAEIERASRNILYALYVALTLMLFLWLFGQQEMYGEYLNMMIFLMKTAGIVCMFSELSRIAVSLLLPVGLACRNVVISALKSKVPSLLCVMLLYGVGLWLYSL